MSVEEAVIILDFKNKGELWFTEITLYICFIVIWCLLLRMLWYFCISPAAPRFKQYDAKALKPIKQKADKAARIRRESEFENTSNATQSTKEPNNTRAPSSSISIKPPNNASANGSYYDLSAEEFRLQICKIHRSLRLCFIASIICTTINVTFVMLNHTLIIASAINRDCLVSKLPVTMLFLQRLALYLFFIFRLHHSFGATTFGVKSIYLWTLIIAIVLCGGSASAYFFLRIVTASDPCESGLAFSAGSPAVAQDYLFNILLSVLFITRLKAVVAHQHKGSTRNLEKAKLKKARSLYKYYYTMYKLTALFLTALCVTVIAFIIMFATGLAAAMSAIDGVLSNLLLFLNFQLNDHYFRRIFCGCLRLQACMLGGDYAKDMELHFYSSGAKPAHKQSSKTWQRPEPTNTVKTAMNKIPEDKDLDAAESSISDDVSSSSTDTQKGNDAEANSTPTDPEENKLSIVVNGKSHNTNTKNKMKLENINSKDSDSGFDRTPVKNTPEDERDPNITPLGDNNERDINMDVP